LEDAKAWTASLLSDLWDKPHLKVIEEDLNQDGEKDLLIAEDYMAGTGGNTYFYFEKTQKGYHYLGNLGFNSIEVLPKDSSGQQKIVTGWHLGANESGITLLTLDTNGFHEIAHATVELNTPNKPTIQDLSGIDKISTNMLQQILEK
ncbi:MAG TPA: hypothetical protein VN516_03440, partial [Candidatus Baltobacteraceae bacterium]|nr:hypothetical protein [Candidatus Baltobacteraceae bacterium]